MDLLCADEGQLIAAHQIAVIEDCVGLSYFLYFD